MRNKPIVLLYVCTRDVDFMLRDILRMNPVLYALSLQVRTSKNALRFLPKTGPITVLTSNIFHDSNNEMGVNGKPEKEMTGEILAGIIKKKNPRAKVYLYSEKVVQSEIFDGVFKRDSNTDIIPSGLQTILNSLFVLPSQPYGQIKTLRDSLRLHRNHLKNAPLNKTEKQRLEETIFEQATELALLLRAIKVTKQRH